MSETRKLKNILIRLRERLQKSGITNRSKWTSFSSHPEMSPAQFTRRLNSLGLQITNKETTSLWKMMQVTSSALKFEDFVKLIESPLPETRAESPKSPKQRSPSPRAVSSPAPENLLIQTLSSNRKALLLKLGECDPLTTGRIANEDFRAICEWFDPRMSPESSAVVDAIVARYDGACDGSFNYFRFLADLCDGQMAESPKRKKPVAEPVTTPKRVVEPRRAVEPEKVSPKRVVFVDQDEPEVEVRPEQTVKSPKRKATVNTSGIDDDLLRAATYDESSTDEEVLMSDESEDEDEEIPKRVVVSTNGARQNLDPMIFPGLQKHTRPRTEGSGTRQTADEIVGTEKMSGLSRAQVLRVMAECVLKTAKGAKEYFQKWRGQHDRIDANDLRDGLAKDMKILIPYEEINRVVKRYGGPMTLSTFVRMLADGAKISEDITRSPTRTLDEEALVKLSEQIHGNGWEDIVYNSTSAEDIVTGFAEKGIKVTSGEIRTLTAKLGRTGLVSAIHARM